MADEREQTRLTLRLPEDIADQLREFAGHTRRSMNATIVLMIQDGLTRKKVSR